MAVQSYNGGAAERQAFGQQQSSPVTPGDLFSATIQATSAD
jgi:hypothetical protein